MPHDVPEPSVGQFKSCRGDVLLHTVTYAAPSPKAILVFVHGYTDHSGRHVPVLAPLVAQGFTLMAYDQYGHGRSGPPRLRSYIGNFNSLVTDLLVFVETVVKRQYPQLPIFVMGHSMGGCVSMLAVCRSPGLFAGLILTSPMVQVQVPSIQASLAANLVWALNWIPGATYWRVVKRRPIAMGMTDPEAVKAMETDTLWDRQPYFLGSVCSMLQATRMLQAEMPAGLAHLPIYMQQGTEDVATLLGPARTFVRRLRQLRAAAGSQPEAAPKLPVLAGSQAEAGKGADANGAASGQLPTAAAAARSRPAAVSRKLGEAAANTALGTDGRGRVQQEVAGGDEEGARPTELDGSGVQYYEVEGGYHDLLHDTATPQCLQRISHWLQAQL